MSIRMLDDEPGSGSGEGGFGSGEGTSGSLEAQPAVHLDPIVTGGALSPPPSAPPAGTSNLPAILVGGCVSGLLLLLFCLTVEIYVRSRRIRKGRRAVRRWRRARNARMAIAHMARATRPRNAVAPLAQTADERPTGPVGKALLSTEIPQQQSGAAVPSAPGVPLIQLPLIPLPRKTKPLMPAWRPPPKPPSEPILAPLPSMRCELHSGLGMRRPGFRRLASASLGNLSPYPYPHPRPHLRPRHVHEQAGQ